MSESRDGTRLVVRGRVAAIERVGTSELGDALRAIPGEVITTPGVEWAVALGPDRAYSLAAIARALGVTLSPESAAVLERLVAGRTPADPVIELVDYGAPWLSLLDDWVSLGIEGLRAIPGSRRQAAARRTEVPLRPSTVEAVRGFVDAYELRLSPAAVKAVGGVDAQHPPASEPSEEAEPWVARMDIRGSVDGPKVAIFTRWGEPPAPVAALNGLVRDQNGDLAPASASNLRLLAPLRDSELTLTFSPAMERAFAWAEGHPDAGEVPPAKLDLVSELGSRRFVVRAIWDDDAERDFSRLEERLTRRHRRERPQDFFLPAEAWRPDRLARFIGSRRLACSAWATEFIESTLELDRDAERLMELSRARDAELEVEGLGGELMPFQRAGVAYALERRRLFVADEQGLGKTIQALATIQADLAYPAVVVCPASLKLNWLREARRWLPDREPMLISGRAGAPLDDADIVVVNYEIVEAHVDALDAIDPMALVLDESHYVKNARARRTRAVLELAERLDPDALRLALTGTPIVNHPAELAPQLRALDRLSEYGSARSFRTRYRTASARRGLHERLRRTCYLRRRKEEVLEQLPEKRRAVVAVPLTNEAEYRRAERDFIRWLATQIEKGEEGSLPETARAAALVRLTALRRLAARGKLDAALEWIESFAQSEERLVVFAHHREIQEAVLERFPRSARILGTGAIEDREANVRAFQAEGGPLLCVCSLEVASHGFTLTAAANVTFLELAWTPAKHDQAEDRLHRIGQRRAVTAWYLLAAGTIDERIAKLLEHKRSVVDSLTDGGEAVSSTLVDELIAGYAEAE